MLLKFSNILAFWVTTWHLEVGNVADLAWERIVSGPWGLHLFSTRDIWALARAKAELRSLGLECVIVTFVSAGARCEVLALGHGALKLDTHRVVGASRFRNFVSWVVCATAWDFQSLLVSESDTHVETALTLEGLRLHVVIAGCWHRLAVLVVEHLALLATETEVGRRGFNGAGLRIVLDLSVNVFRA